MQTIHPPLNNVPFNNHKFIDPKVTLGDHDKWARLYEEIITKQSK